MKWLAVNPIVGLPATSRPKPVASVSESRAHVLVVAVLLREDVRHVLVGDRARGSGRRPSPRAGRGSSPTAPARTTRAARAPAPSTSTTPTRGRSRRSGAEPHLVLDEQAAGGEQAVALPVEHVVPVARGPTRDGPPRPRRARRRPTPRAARSGRARARASGREHARSSAVREQAQTVVVGRRTPELQARARRAGRSGRRRRELRQHAGRRGRRPPACRRPRARSPRRPRSAARAMRGRRGRTRARAAARAAARPPRGRRAPIRSARRRKNRKVTNRSPVDRARRGRARRRASPPAGTRSARQAAAAHDRAVVVGQLPLAAQIGEVGEVAAVADPEAAGAALLDATPAGRGT